MPSTRSGRNAKLKKGSLGRYDINDEPCVAFSLPNRSRKGLRLTNESTEETFKKEWSLFGPDDLRRSGGPGRTGHATVSFERLAWRSSRNVF